MARPKGSKNAVRTKKANIDYVTAVVVPVGLHKFSGHIRQLLTKTFAVNAIVFCQHRPDRLFQRGHRSGYRAFRRGAVSDTSKT